MISPTEHIRLKEECRRRGVEVFSIFTFDTDNRRQETTVKDIILLSRMKQEEVMVVAVEYFSKLGYIGEVKVRHVEGNTWKAVLSNRLRY